MNAGFSELPLGVFTSLDTGLGVKLSVLADLNVPTVHLHAPSAERRTAAVAAEVKAEFSGLGITPTCVFAGFEGESYADIPTVGETVGLVPPATREKRAAEFLEIAEFASLLGVRPVGLHIGALPHDKGSADFAAMVSLTRGLCEKLASSDQVIHLETGQEPADVLKAFLEEVGCKNLFINFDPANMILYGCGEPLEALATVGRYVRGVHCKDAKWSPTPGKTWGTEVPVGQGDVDFPAFLKLLAELGYEGPLTIEREIPQDPQRQLEEIGQTTGYLRQLLSAM